MATKEQVVEVLKTCYDPEIKMDVWTLGLIYDLKIEQDLVKIKMTFTTPFCPYGEFLLYSIREEIMKLGGLKDVEIEVTFEPPWKPSEELKIMLGVN